ncbi:MAG: multicopper oxidase domain-containing protein [Thermodesulfobacteriota bacterium]
MSQARIEIAAVVFLSVLSAASVAVAAGEADAELAYRTYCTPCHGLAGNGKGINVASMAVQPRDHTDTREMATRSDQDLFNAITGGGPAVGKSALMPPWRSLLDDDQVWALVKHLRKLSHTEQGGAAVGAPRVVAAAAEAPSAAAAATAPRPAPPPVAPAVAGPSDVVAPPPPAKLKARYPESQLRELEIRVEEREVEVAPGFSAKVWAFNGQVPGPLIHVREGDEVKVRFVNLSSMEHTIHWHGMHQQGTWQSDGVPNVTQQPVPPGGSYVYHFIATRPGTLWYHCHVNVAEHIAVRGMWGPLIVDPLEPTPLEKEVTKDAILMFSGWNSQLADRYGVGGHPSEVRDYFSINGKSFPLTQPLRVREGDVVRLRLIGAGANAAFHLHGHDVLVTHKDGLPLESPYWADVVRLEEGERLDAIVRMDNPGIWMTHDHVDGHVTNAGKDMGGSMLIFEYEGIDKPDWYVWKQKPYDPNFYYGESLAAGYGLFEHPGFQGAEAQGGTGRP